ncbi:MAG TPA: tetratricopeptide repeat protein [Chitinophagales bacterium]|nr:tetratricopeptide repeat protein [Chitinophagales bacterium]
MRTGIAIAIVCAFVSMLTFCTNNKGEATENVYLNANDTVSYVGMETCKLCHADKHATFIHTGMGMSFDKATKSKSAALFDAEHALVYDSTNNFYYKPFWRNDTLQIMEFRLDGQDTIHKRIEPIAFIIGSGQHTNSHMLQVNGYVYQAPITFYTQKQQWDLAPGMSGGFNSRFSRVIEAECMTCHNGLPELVAGSVNKYAKVPSGIDCERCHGPGSLHVARVSNGELVDTSKNIDYSIVNPRKLSVELQNQLCMRCHLQGVNVLNEGASFFDFKPGDHINEHWNIFLPRFDGSNNKFLMASQADRLLQSKCYTSTHQLSCITCHNPHITVKDTPREQFNAPCKQCHGEGNTQCKASIASRNNVADDCSSCHIRKSGSIDIPHVSISDHIISIPKNTASKGSGTFKGLVCLTDSNPDPLTMARGYLHYYESFNKEKSLLDSAWQYIQKAGKENDEVRSVKVHYYYLKDAPDQIIQSGEKIKEDKLNAWTAYRMGEAYTAKSDFAAALKYFNIAVEREPLNLDYLFKQATAMVFSGDNKSGEAVYRKIVGENPEYEKAWNNLGVILLTKGQMPEAEQCLLKAIALNPDYTLSRIKLTELYIQSRQKSKAKSSLEYLQRYDADDPAVILLAQKLRSI